MLLKTSVVMSSIRTVGSFGEVARDLEYSNWTKKRVSDRPQVFYTTGDVIGRRVPYLHIAHFQPMNMPRIAGFPIYLNRIRG